MYEKSPNQDCNAEHNVENSEASHVLEVTLWRKRPLSDAGFQPDAASEEIGLAQI